MRIPIKTRSFNSAILCSALPFICFPSYSADLPIGTFRIQDAYGRCMQAESISSTHVVRNAACSSTNLRQRWIYDPITKRLTNSGTLKCMQYGYDSIGGDIIAVEPCDSGDDQKWGRYEATSGSETYAIYPYINEGLAVQADSDLGEAYYAYFPASSPVGTAYRYTFILL